MPRSREQNEFIKDETRQKIVDAARGLFAKKGLAATSVADIAAAAGISAGLLYHYFASKEQLFGELVRTAVEGSGGSIGEIERLDLDCSGKIKLISSLMAGGLSKDDTLAQFFLLMMRASLDGNLDGDGEAKGSQKPVELLAKIIAEGQAEHNGKVKPGDPVALSLLYWAAVQGLCNFKLMLGEGFIPPAAEQLEGILLN